MPANRDESSKQRARKTPQESVAARRRTTDNVAKAPRRTIDSSNRARGGQDANLEVLRCRLRPAGHGGVCRAVVEARLSAGSEVPKRQQGGRSQSLRRSTGSPGGLELCHGDAPPETERVCRKGRVEFRRES